MHYDILMLEKELPIEESSEISNSKKLTYINNNQLKNNSVEKINNGEDNFISIPKSLNLKTSDVLSFLTTKPPYTCLSETALRNGCYTNTFLDLMSLEASHTSVLMRMKILRKRGCNTAAVQGGSIVPVLVSN